MKQFRSTRKTIFSLLFYMINKRFLFFKSSIHLITFFVISSFVFGCTGGLDVVEDEAENHPYEVPQGSESPSSALKQDSLVIKKYMGTSSTGSVQGASCYGDLVFQFQDKNAAVYVYDMKSKSLLERVVLPARVNNHCNNVSFGLNLYMPTDEFPLIYVSGSNVGTYNNVQVYRIIQADEHFSFEKVQEIVLPTASDENNLYWAGVVMDTDKGFMYVYSNGTKNAQIAKFSTPAIDKPSVELDESSILDRFIIKSFVHQQGACIHKGKLYVFDGVPSLGDRNRLRIIDLANKRDYYEFYTSQRGFVHEAEGAFFWNNDLYCIANGSNGIFKFTGSSIEN